MKTTGNVFGLLLILGVGFYVYSLRTQSRDVAELCSVYPEGASVTNLAEIAGGYSGRLMGPFKLEDKPGTEAFIFCSPLTMCDVSCSLEIKDGVVIKSAYSSH